MDTDTTARLSADSEKRVESSRAHNGVSEQQQPPFGHDIEQGQEGAADDKTDDTDPNLVDWDGPDDPENPMNWSLSKKNINVLLVSVFTFLTSLASSIFAPALDLVVRDFGEPQPELTSFILSVYLLGYCFGPLIVAPLSEIYGRVPLYHVCNVLFIAWTIACALAPSLGALIAFRFLAGLSASCPTSIGGGSVADLIPQRRRGAYMSIWTFGPLWGPILGPIAGGYLSEALGWRWCFWLVTIVAGILTVPMILFLKETYAPALLERKASRLREETGNEKLRSRMSSGKTQKEVIKLAIVRPTKMLIFSPVTLLMAVYIAVMYGQLYCLFSGMSYVFEVAYGYSAGQIGLTFLGPGIGSMIGVFIAGMATDRVAIHLSKRNGGQMLPKYRLPMCFVGGVFAPIGLFWFGWASHQREHWVVPLIGTSLFGASVVIALMSVSTYLVDAFERYAASALGANMVLRSLVAALLPLSGRGLYESLGIGWGNSVLAFLGVAIIPVPVLLYMYGERLRQKTFFNVTF